MPPILSALGDSSYNGAPLAPAWLRPLFSVTALSHLFAYLSRNDTTTHWGFFGGFPLWNYHPEE